MDVRDEHHVLWASYEARGTVRSEVMLCEKSRVVFAPVQGPVGRRGRLSCVSASYHKRPKVTSKPHLNFLPNTSHPIPPKLPSPPPNSAASSWAGVYLSTLLHPTLDTVCLASHLVRVLKR
jgi:hypothetical protein